MAINNFPLLNYRKFSSLTIIFSLIPALYVTIFPGKSALISVICSYPLIVLLLIHSKKSFHSKFDSAIYVNIFLLYNIIVLFRGVLNAKSDEDWRAFFVIDIPIYLFVHFTMYLAYNKNSIISAFSSFLSYGLIISALIFFLPFKYQFGFPKAVSPVYILLFIIPYLSKKYALFILSLAFISLFSDLDSRSNVLNIVIAILIVITFYFKNRFLTISIIKQVRKIILTAPVLLLILGVYGVFNIFLIGDYLSSNEESVEDILVDSRTGIYTDVFNQLDKDNMVLFGLGASGKTETYLVDLLSIDFSEIYKEGRRGTESGMLNYIQWGGAIGGILYFLLFVKGSYYGIYRSNNWFCVMVGLWVAYKGLFSFIEDRPNFSIDSIFIFFAIGMCLNKELRNFSDVELKILFERMIRKTFILRFLNSKYRFYVLDK
ncbi:hypothetical protein Q4534_23360 [Cyclobacterium sp. 1_MG-2023]|uniref:hypothetical protein n=1 Tax=Cyclobacterium sp. 1_MG-2023 TaxID=3062681 RepID=UPI0026E2FA60|nr:hypothetical protein [Cyclobacterium sp. 1_MG-2023]MDO6440385.1 hypothetical protein [Cyclobacterium sp. 1_MG-2023]